MVYTWFSSWSYYNKKFIFGTIKQTSIFLSINSLNSSWKTSQVDMTACLCVHVVCGDLYFLLAYTISIYLKYHPIKKCKQFFELGLIITELGHWYLFFWCVKQVLRKIKFRANGIRLLMLASLSLSVRICPLMKSWRQRSSLDDRICWCC